MTLVLHEKIEAFDFFNIERRTERGGMLIFKGPALIITPSSSKQSKATWIPGQSAMAFNNNRRTGWRCLRQKKSS